MLLPPSCSKPQVFFPLDFTYDEKHRQKSNLKAEVPALSKAPHVSRVLFRTPCHIRAGPLWWLALEAEVSTCQPGGAEPAQPPLRAQQAAQEAVSAAGLAGRGTLVGSQHWNCCLLFVVHCFSEEVLSAPVAGRVHQLPVFR